MVTDYRNRICDCRKASFKGHQDWKNLDVTTTFSDFNSLTTSSKTIFAIFWNSNQIYDKNMTQVIGNV